MELQTVRYTKRTVQKFLTDKKKFTYVPLQTREHAWAGMSGMLRFGGARGAFYVPRR